MRWNEFLSKSIRVNPKSAPAAALSRAVAKWWLDLARNLVVLGALQYVAFRSGNTILKGLSLATYLFFFAYFMTQFDLWAFNPFFSVKNPRLQAALPVLSHVVVALIPLALGAAVFVSIEQVARGQTPPPSSSSFWQSVFASEAGPPNFTCRRWVRAR
jgi:hypothetical protein